MRESDHYVFHYFKDSLAEKEIETIIKTQEDAFAQILSFLEIPSPTQKISYYLYPDPETKEKLMGTPWYAQSIYNEFAVHALYSETDRVVGPHEDTHLLSLPFGLSIGFLQEGLAERMVGHDWHGNAFEDVVKETLTDEKFVISPSLLTDHQAWIDTNDDYARQYYSLAALFTDHVIATFGKYTYFKLYKSLNRNAAPEENDRQYQQLLHQGSLDIWNAFLAKYPLN